MTTEVEVVHVFTDDQGRHGNPLAIVDSAAVPAPDRQEVAARWGFSATVFVDLPAEGADSARAAIFTPQVELPFAGHPTVGLAWWLAEHGRPVRTRHVSAGPVEIRRSGHSTWAKALVDWAPRFALVPLETPADVDRARPDDYPAGPHYLWAWIDEFDARVRARMFAPELGIREDEATGAAAVRLTAHLRHALLVEQGRGSILRTTFGSQGWIEVGGLVRAGRSRML